MNYPVISDHPGVQKLYEQMRADGSSHKLAEMLALQSPPMSNTDREFLEGQHEQFAATPHHGDYYAKQAKRHGLANTKGLTYMPGLARFPGDPQAWVTGRGDVAKVVEKNGWACDGSVKVNAMRQEEPKVVDVAPDIVQDVAERRMVVDPDLRHKDRRTVLEETKDMIAPSAATLRAAQSSFTPQE